MRSLCSRRQDALIFAPDRQKNCLRLTYYIYTPWRVTLLHVRISAIFSHLEHTVIYYLLRRTSGIKPPTLARTQTRKRCEWSWSSYKTNHLIIIERPNSGSNEHCRTDTALSQINCYYGWGSCLKQGGWHNALVKSLKDHHGRLNPIYGGQAEPPGTAAGLNDWTFFFTQSITRQWRKWWSQSILFWYRYYPQ